MGTERPGPDDSESGIEWELARLAHDLHGKGEYEYSAGLIDDPIVYNDAFDDPSGEPETEGADGADSFVEATTYKKVVADSRGLEELIEKISRFGMERTAKLPPNASLDDLRAVVADFVALFLESVQAACHEQPEQSEMEIAIEVLRRLRRPPEEEDVPGQRAGFRQRIKEALLKRIGSRKRAETAPEEFEEVLLEVPRALFVELNSLLSEASDQCLKDALDSYREQSRQRSHASAIIDILDERAMAPGSLERGATRLGHVLRTLRPDEILKTSRSRDASPEGTRRQAWLSEVERVTRDLGGQVEALRVRETHRQTEQLALWLGTKLKEYVRATRSP